MSEVIENYKPKVFSVIVTFNAMKWIDDCLDSVITDSTIIIVDNQSSDNTVDYIKENYKEIIILRQENNLGFGKGNNVGISYALAHGADFVLLLNQDARMDKGAVVNLVNFQKANPNYGILSPIHCDWTGQSLEASFSRYVSYENNENFYSDFVLRKPIKYVYDVPFVAAACWLLPKEVFLNVGGFDPIFKHLGEDNNYVQRIKYHNFKIGVLPSFKVMHDTANRKYNKVNIYSKEYFHKQDYKSKIKFADINIDNWRAKIKYAKTQVKKNIFWSITKLNIKYIWGGLKHLKLLNRIKTECEYSRAINIKTGNHYLN